MTVITDVSLLGNSLPNEFVILIGINSKQVLWFIHYRRFFISTILSISGEKYLQLLTRYDYGISALKAGLNNNENAYVVFSIN
jgi:hypothetical protein